MRQVKKINYTKGLKKIKVKIKEKLNRE